MKLRTKEQLLAKLVTFRNFAISHCAFGGKSSSRLGSGKRFGNGGRLKAKKKKPLLSRISDYVFGF